MPNCQSDTHGDTRDKTRVEQVKAPVVSIERIKQTLRAERLVEDVRTYDASDFVYGLCVEIDIPEGCSFQLTKVIRDLGLYIESVRNYGDHETLKLRRFSRVLERMESAGKFDSP